MQILTNCQYKKEEDIFRCELCGHTTKIENLRHTCPKKVKGFGQRTKNLGKAIHRGIKEGASKLSQEEVDERWNICVECPFYQEVTGTNGICTHSHCGCNINASNILANKLSWSTESCPIGKW